MVNKTTKMLHPKDKVSLLNDCFFCWPFSVVLSHKRKKHDDFLVPTKYHDSNESGNTLEKSWKLQLLKKKPSLIKALFKVFWLKFTLIGATYFVFDIIVSILQPLFLEKLVSFFEQKENSATKKEAYIYGVVLVLTSFIRSLGFQNFNSAAYHFGLKVHTACSSLIYRKVLSLPKSTLQQITTGKLLNFISTDVDKFDKTFSYIHCVWITPLKLLGCAWFLSVYVGYEELIGIAVIVILMIFQCFVFNYVKKFTTKAAIKTDHRIRLITDIVSGIQVIKMYSWEHLFSSLVYDARRAELETIKKSNQVQSINYTLFAYFYKLPVYFYILFIVLLGKTPTASAVFVTITIYDSMKITLQYALFGINQTSQLYASIKRIENFLLVETKKYPLVQVSSEDAISIRNFNAKWDPSSPNQVLNNINFQAGSRELVAIVGSSGSGKSSLLQSILKEMIVNKGNIHVKGTLSYASQEPWLFPDTIRNNILFGAKLEEEKYRKVIRICSLEEDLSLFPFGDNSLVGERGVLLSGGQKARLNLARAIYKDADIYLLDDPLSAVDAKVAYQIFTECVLSYLSDKTVVLVTHQLKLLNNMDKIYVLQEGKVHASGTYNQLKDLIGETTKKYKRKDLNNLVLEDLPHNLLQTEMKEDCGNQHTNSYRSYLLASGSWCYSFLHLLNFTLAHFFLSASDVFLSFWVDSKFVLNLSFFTFTTLNCLYIYSGIYALMVFFFHFSSFSVAIFFKKVSSTLFDALFDKVLRGSMVFFDQHASGRILNRFSKDVAIIDSVIPKEIHLFLDQVLLLLSIVIIMLILNYWLIIPAIVFIGVFCFYFFTFRSALSYFKKTSATRRSPIFTHISTTVQGLSTIKAQDGEYQSILKFDELQNRFNAVEYTQMCIYYAYSYWSDVLATVFVAFVIFYLLIYDESSAGNAGLFLTQSLLFVGSVQYTLKGFGEVDYSMTSVDRVVQYSDLTPEPDNGTLEPPNWPQTGKLGFSSVFLKYDSKPYVLKNINFEVSAGEKVGIVGRTGAGKSSLSAVLFRLYDFSGSVIIDDVDTKLVPLKYLRSKIAVIPQDPVLFLGTIRRNLDPFGEYTDCQIWSALQDVSLKKKVSGLLSGLDSCVLEGGANFSVGERQMLCLVRAVLKNCKIVVLDEATANVDVGTDELIQAAVKRKFERATVLTIAHRLDTVMHMDKILVMEKGVVVEFGTKDELLKNRNGHFYKLVNQNFGQQ